MPDNKSVDWSDVAFGLLVGIFGMAILMLIMGYDIMPAEPLLSDYRKVEACEMILRATFRVPDFITCLENNGLTLVKK